MHQPVAHRRLRREGNGLFVGGVSGLLLAQLRQPMGLAGIPRLKTFDGVRAEGFQRIQPRLRPLHLGHRRRAAQ